PLTSPHLLPDLLPPRSLAPRALPSFPTRRSSDLEEVSLPESRLTDEMRARLAETVGEDFVRDDHATRVSHAAGRSLPGRMGDAGDRKSTRLNSSHVSISYAVFCLKKKSDTSALVT